MRKLLAAMAALTVGLAAWVGLGSAGPVAGSVGGYFKLDPREAWTKKIKFQGGQRACVIAMGDHDPVVPITIEIRDAQDRVVASDEPAKVIPSGGAGADLAAAIWYPPRDAEYTVKVTNHGSQWNKIWIAVK